MMIALISIVLSSVSCKKNKEAVEQPEEVSNIKKDIIAKLPGQFPEGLAYDKNRNLFFLSAINENPSIAAIEYDGNAKSFTNDGGLKSSASFGLEVDYKNNRLLACTNNKKSGNVHIYNLDSGELKHSINLSVLLPEDSKFQANDLVVDSQGNIYVTGRLENCIYKIDSELNTEIFLKNEKLIKPNGIVYNTKDFLVVSLTNDDSKLVKIPLDNPDSWEEVQIEGFDFVGFDGMLYNEKGNIVAISKAPEEGQGFAVELSSKDNWSTAELVMKKIIRRSTTVAQVGPNEYYAVNQDWKDRNGENWVLEYIKL
ncbi:SMP-30/gluconolactonase/LRE family protein [Algibacter mikhailovii]|uniref:SMP-30/gluconolactonase/LRE family protein n=1 Tax=Algibacter mikhailovii TaxID=425498 RepID=UPI0024945D34|nr:SMP-30/gluconolactonase/LRE family protein [Algibacter mikhailovii]